MDEGGMSELYSDAIDKAMPIDNRWNEKKTNGHKNVTEWDDRLIVGAKEESLVALVDDGGFVKVESRLVVNGNPPEFFDLMAEVLAVEEIDHPLHAHKTALQ